MRTAQLGSDEGQPALQDVMQRCSYGFAVIVHAQVLVKGVIRS